MQLPGDPDLARTLSRDITDLCGRASGGALALSAVCGVRSCLVQLQQRLQQWWTDDTSIQPSDRAEVIDTAPVSWTALHFAADNQAPLT